MRTRFSVLIATSTSTHIAFAENLVSANPNTVVGEEMYRASQLKIGWTEERQTDGCTRVSKIILTIPQRRIEKDRVQFGKQKKYSWVHATNKNVYHPEFRAIQGHTVCAADPSALPDIFEHHWQQQQQQSQEQHRGAKTKGDRRRRIGHQTTLSTTAQLQRLRSRTHARTFSHEVSLSFQRGSRLSSGSRSQDCYFAYET